MDQYYSHGDRYQAEHDFRELQWNAKKEKNNVMRTISVKTTDGTLRHYVRKFCLLKTMGQLVGGM